MKSAADDKTEKDRKGNQTMKKILSILLAGVMIATTAVAFAGCGCDSKKAKKGGSAEPGYKVVPTDPDLKDKEFGFYRLNKEELMVSSYFGNSKNIKIPDTYENYKVTVVGHGLFQNSDIESVEIPDTVTEVQDYSFASNKNLSSVKLSQNLKVIGNNAFWDCKNLKSIELPGSLKKIGVYAFSATGLTSVEIPQSDTLSTIDRFTFYQSFDLKEVTIPITITNIADDAFNECSKDLIIKAYSDSYGLSYAKKHSYKTEELAR